MKPREQRLLDALEALPRTAFKGKVWRVVREGRDPAQCSAAGGRWDDGSFEVLHTACERDGALCEMYFHLLRGQPVFPSKLRFTLFELEVQTAATLSLPGLPDLTALGWTFRATASFPMPNGCKNIHPRNSLAKRRIFWISIPSTSPVPATPAKTSSYSAPASPQTPSRSPTTTA